MRVILCYANDAIYASMMSEYLGSEEERDGEMETGLSARVVTIAPLG